MGNVSDIYCISAYPGNKNSVELLASRFGEVKITPYETLYTFLLYLQLQMQMIKTWLRIASHRFSTCCES